MIASPSRLPREDGPTRKVRRAAPRPTATIGNGTSAWETVADERQARCEAIDEQVTVYRAVLPQLLAQVAHIRDPRHPKTVRHTTTTLLLYGMLACVFQMASRREANRQMTMPVFWDHLRLVFPEVETLPHQDTLNRLLAVIEVDQIETMLLALVARFLRQKKFTRHQIAHRYPIAIDCTQKLGLYANGPVMAWCRRAHWQFMIVLQDASLPSARSSSSGPGTPGCPANRSTGRPCTSAVTWAPGIGGGSRATFWWRSGTATSTNTVFPSTGRR